MDSLELAREAGSEAPPAVAWAPGPLAWGPGIPEIFPSCPKEGAAPFCLALILSSGQHQRQPCSLLWVFFSSWMDLQFDCHHGNSRVLVHEGGEVFPSESLSNCCKEHVWQLLACGETSRLQWSRVQAGCCHVDLIVWALRFMEPVSWALICHPLSL